MDFLAELLASTGGPWVPCHTPDVIGLIITATMTMSWLLGYAVGRHASHTRLESRSTETSEL